MLVPYDKYRERVLLITRKHYVIGIGAVGTFQQLCNLVEIPINTINISNASGLEKTSKPSERLEKKEEKEENQ